MESPPTTSKDLDRLSLCPTDEPCVSVKVAFCHGKKLFESGAEVLFVPAVVSLSRTAYCCPKMMGLPAMLRAGLELEGWQVVSPVIDMRDDPRGWRNTWVRAGWSLGVRDASRSLAALDRGLAAWRRAEKDQVSGEPRGRGGTAVMGHAYMLGDIFARKVVEVAREYGPVVLPEMVSPEDAQSALRSVPDGEKVWTIEGHILGSCLHLIRSRKVDRVIFVSAFSCGPASIIENYIAGQAEDTGVPLLNLAVDEHTGDAGLVTRLEAFLDSVGRPWRLLQAQGVVSAADRGPWEMRLPRDTQPPQDTRLTRKTAGPRPLEASGLVSMGNLDLVLSTLLREAGLPLAPPPPLSDEIVGLGKEIAPEFICYPMVTLIGQMRRHAEQGVTRVLMVQGKGRCRLGWYAQVMEQILRRNGCPVTVLSVDSPFPLKSQGKAFVDSIRQIAGDFSVARVLRGLELALAKMAALDRAEDILREVRATEEARGAGDARHAEFVRDMGAACSLAAIVRSYRRFASDMRHVPAVECDPLRIAVVGEIYVVNEPFVNKQVEKALGSLERRVRVFRRLDVTGWVSCHLLRTPGAVRDCRIVTSFAEPYLPLAVGGHGQESVGETVLAKRRGMDGVLHLFPFTCMPEVIAQNVLVRVSRDLDIPVLSLMISEQTGVAGLATRLEAFCDLLAGRRRLKGPHGPRG